MNLDLFGKWYVYRYSFNLSDPESSLSHPNRLLKAAETTLEIRKQTNARCLARFELSAWSKPAEIEMIADANGSWISKEEGSFNFLEFRWTRVELDDEKPAVLMGHVFDKDNPAELRDFFVAVRSRRTKRLPKRDVYQFGGAYYTPFKRSEPLESWGNNISVRPNEKRILIDSNTYDILSKERYQGGLVVTSQLQKQNGLDHLLALWILPVAEPEDPGDLLAIGYYDPHLLPPTASGSSDPQCQGGTGTGGKPN